MLRRGKVEYDSLLELVKQRKSFRRFKTDPVPKETVEKILEVARFSPSAANSQPWEFIIVEDKESDQKQRAAHW